MPEGRAQTASGVIVDQQGHLLTTYFGKSARNFIVTLDNGTRLKAQLIESSRRRRASLLKIEGEKKFPAVKISGAEAKANGWTVMSGFGQYRLRAQQSRLRLGRTIGAYRKNDSRYLCDTGYHAGRCRCPGLRSRRQPARYRHRYRHSGVPDARHSISQLAEYWELLGKIEVQKVSEKTLTTLTLDEQELPEEAKAVNNRQNRVELRQALNKRIAASAASLVEIRAGDKPLIYGTVISSDGYILTKLTEIGEDLICTINGKNYPAFIYAEDDKSDLALLKVNATNLKAVEWADFNTGQFIISPCAKVEEYTSGLISSTVEDLNEFFHSSESPEAAASLGIIFEHGSNSCTVAAFTMESTAREAGLKLGDQITSINGQEINGRDTFHQYSPLSTGR